MKHTIVAAAVALAGVAVAPAAYAGGSVSASYFTLTSSNPDVEGPIPGGGATPGLVKTMLGPDGLPVEIHAGNVRGRQFGRRIAVVVAGRRQGPGRDVVRLSVNAGAAVQHPDEFLPGWPRRKQRRRRGIHIGNSVGHVCCARRGQRDLQSRLG